VTHPYGNTPIATYIFQYRTRSKSPRYQSSSTLATDNGTGDLEIEGIVERAPSPVPLVDRNPDELTPEELREQIRLLRAARQPAVKIKKESKPAKRARKRPVPLNNDDDDEGDVTFVSESNKRRRTKESMEGEDVIDLSND